MHRIQHSGRFTAQVLWLLPAALMLPTTLTHADHPGWRSGNPFWNGTGYDLPRKITPPVRVSGESVTAKSESDNKPAYTVPIVPTQPRLNPYLQDDSGEVARSVALPRSISGSTVKTSDTTPVTKPTKPAAESEQVAMKAGTEPSPAPVAAVTDPAENAVAVEQPPLEEQVIRWYQYPRRWMQGWDSHAEFGIDGSDGNADTLAIQTGLETKRKTDLHTFAIDIDYRHVTSRSSTTENNGRLNADYDRLVANSAWSAFSKLGLEWDRFKAFDLRLNLNGGVGYHWIRQDDASLVSRVGAGASREFGAPIDQWTPEAVFGIEAERQVNDRNKLKGKLDYFPAWEDFGDFRLVADAAWEILLDDSENLSLKLAVTDRYDSTPQGAEPNDVYYSLLLLYKF